MYNIEEDIQALSDRLTTILDPLLDAYSDADHPAIEGTTPTVLARAFAQLLELLYRVDSPAEAELESSQEAPNLDPRGITELTEYGFTLLNQLTVWLAKLRVTDQQENIDAATVMLTLWSARHNGELDNLDAVVDALARYANHTKSPEQLALMYQHIALIIKQVSPTIKQDLDKANPGRPWRILLLNFAIVATRSHHPDYMEHAYAELINVLPEDAPQFFAQGMQQMDALDYPAHVRSVMQRYYQQFCNKPALH